MKCISLWQPWATLLVSGYKIHETRSWPTNVRGPVAIHAAKHKDAEARDLVLENPFCDALNHAKFNDLPFGCLIGIVQLVDCIPTEVAYPDNWDHDREEFYFGNFDPGRWAWKCEHPMMLSEPIPYRGMQGFFEVPDELFSSEIKEANTRALLNALLDYSNTAKAAKAAKRKARRT